MLYCEDVNVLQNSLVLPVSSFSAMECSIYKLCLVLWITHVLTMTVSGQGPIKGMLGVLWNHASPTTSCKGTKIDVLKSQLCFVNRFKENSSSVRRPHA